MGNLDYKNLFPELTDKLVLNVDDNEMNQMVIGQIMRNAGIQIVPALNGAEAIDKLKGGLKPDAILLDLEMPVMNGVDTANFIRKNVDPKIAIIINSGYISGLEKWKLGRLGIEEYLEKPYSMMDIFTKLAKHIPAGIS